MKKEPVITYDREKQEEVVENVYGRNSLFFLYRNSLPARAVLFIIKQPLFAQIYAALQNTRFSRRKIGKVVRQFDIDSSEFKRDIDDFETFNDFFTRELREEKRPIAGDSGVAVTPCDAKYLVFQCLPEDMPLSIKDDTFYLDNLLEDEGLAERYRDGSMAVVRLDPTDYHRFHFPVDCVPGRSRLINGYLYPVNPYALYQNIKLFNQDKRAVTELDSAVFGRVLFVEVGATTVGSINQTYRAGTTYKRGAEKGYFSFGGSSIVMLFERGKIEFDPVLLRMTERNIEVKSRYGQPLGTAVR